jgi:putative heme transporter
VAEPEHRRRRLHRAHGGEPATEALGPPRASPAQTLARGALTLLLLVLIGWLLFKNIGNVDDVVDALKGVSTEDAILLVLLTLLWQCLVGSQLAATVPGIGIGRAMVAVESASAVSNVVPGPSGTATRLMILRSWGFYTDDFARSWLFTSTLTNFTVLAMPAVAIVLVAINHNVDSTVVIIGLVGLAISIAGVVAVVGILRNERFARWFGAKIGVVVRWATGLRGRTPSKQDFVESTLDFRESIGETWHERGVRVSLAVLATYAAQGAIFGLSLRAVGLDSQVLPAAAIAVVYTVVRLLTIVNLTPGGVGVVETLYTAALLAVTDGADQSEIVAGVILFRGLTYIGPILLGAGALLIWRFRRRWRVRAPAEPQGQAAVGSVLAGREPPTTGG